MPSIQIRYHENQNILNAKDKSYDEVEEVINLKVDKKIVRLILDKINYFESFGDYAICRYDGRKYISRETMAHLMEILPSEKFIRIHRQFIVPFAKIESIFGNTVSLSGKDLPIGRSYRKELKERMKL